MALAVAAAVGVREPDTDAVSEREGERVRVDVRLGVRDAEMLIVGVALGVAEARAS